MAKICIFIFAIYFSVHVFAYPTGAPCSQIVPMTPKHRGGRFDANPPYVIELSSSCYQPGIAITVTLKPSKQDKLKGFILQSRVACDTNAALNRTGRFLGTHGDWQRQCVDDDASLTHTWKDHKTAIVADWVGPAAGGQVVFVATIVADYSTYWVQAVRSVVISKCGEAVKPACVNQPRDTLALIEPTTPSAANSSRRNVSARCTQPFDAGKYCSLKGYQSRYFYRDGYCLQFWFGGYVCSDTPVDAGHWCTDKQQYSYKDGKCVAFTYLGCGGSLNRFDTAADCQAKCIDRTCAIYEDLNESCAGWLRFNTNICEDSETARLRCARTCCAKWEGKQ